MDGGVQCLTNYFVANSIFWNSGPGSLPSLLVLNGNYTSDVYVQYQYTLVNAAYDQDGKLRSIYGGIAADPKWLDPANGSYDLGPTSPALNTGAENGLLGMPSNDMIGQARNIGVHPDMGALIERGKVVLTISSAITITRVPGSLRQAILDANVNADDRPRSSPAARPVPAGDRARHDAAPITSPVRIWGFSQNGGRRTRPLLHPSACCSTVETLATD